MYRQKSAVDYCIYTVTCGTIKTPKQAFVQLLVHCDIQEGKGPEGTRGGRVVWVLGGKYLAVTGFDRYQAFNSFTSTIGALLASRVAAILHKYTLNNSVVQ